MFIELTDLLRCPADHAESFLVLLPDEMQGRFVRRGRLGCPVCHREFPIEEGIARFGLPLSGGPAVPTSSVGDPVDPGALQAFLGIEGPGGYAALVGSAARFAPGMRALLPGVQWVAVNPPPDVREQEGVSSLEAPLIPVLSRSLRGVVLGQGYGENSYWEHEAARAVLPGLRVVGVGIASLPAELELLGDAGGWWVGKKR